MRPHPTSPMRIIVSRRLHRGRRRSAVRAGPRARGPRTGADRRRRGPRRVDAGRSIVVRRFGRRRGRRAPSCSIERASPARRAASTDTPRRRTPRPRSTAPSNSRAVRPMSRARSVGAGERLRAGARAGVAEPHLDPTVRATSFPASRRAGARSLIADRSRSAARSRRSVGTSPRARSTWRPIGLDRAVVAIPGQRVRMPPDATPTHARASLRGARRGRRSSDPEALEPASRRGPTPQRRATGSGGRNSAGPGATTSSPSGLARSLASFAGSLVVATPTDAAEPGLVAHAPRISAAISGPSRAGGARRHVEERLVERDRLDERRERAQDRHDRAALAV